MNSFECLRCHKKFASEELVKAHLQWEHDIPPRKLVEGLEKLKKEMLFDITKEDLN